MTLHTLSTMQSVLPCDSSEPLCLYTRDRKHRAYADLKDYSFSVRVWEPRHALFTYKSVIWSGHVEPAIFAKGPWIAPGCVMRRRALERAFPPASPLRPARQYADFTSLYEPCHMGACFKVAEMIAYLHARKLKSIANASSLGAYTFLNPSVAHLTADGYVPQANLDNGAYRVWDPTCPVEQEAYRYAQEIEAKRLQNTESCQILSLYSASKNEGDKS